MWVLGEACVGFVEIRCVRVSFNPCPSFPVVPVGTDLLECKQPWITVGSLFQLHKATKPWEQPFTQLVIIRGLQLPLSVMAVSCPKADAQYMEHI